MDFGSNTEEKLKTHEAKFQSQIPNPTSPQKDVVNNTTTVLVVVSSFHFLWYLSRTQHHGFLVEFGFKSYSSTYLDGEGCYCSCSNMFSTKSQEEYFSWVGGKGFLAQMKYWEKFNFRKQTFSYIFILSQVFFLGHCEQISPRNLSHQL